MLFGAFCLLLISTLQIEINGSVVTRFLAQVSESTEWWVVWNILLCGLWFANFFAINLHSNLSMDVRNWYLDVLLCPEVACRDHVCENTALCLDTAYEIVLETQECMHEHWASV